MGYRLFDWTCGKCAHEHEELVECVFGAGAPNTADLHCAECGTATVHQRCAVTLTAKYLGEMVECPQVYGGRNDTMGRKELPYVPDMAGEAEHRASLQAKIKALGPDAPQSARNDVMREMGKCAPSIADYATHFEKPEIKSVMARRQRIKAENAQKQKRASALARGDNINFRRDKCAGDPALAS